MIAAMDPIVGVILVAIVGPLGTYLVAARKLSGKIGSSDASELWQESRSIRDWSQTQIATLTARVAAVEQQNAELANANSGLIQQIRDLSDLLVAARKELVAARKEIADLTTELRAANARVAELERKGK